MREKAKGEEFIDELVDTITARFWNKSGIIYCATIKSSEWLRDSLKQRGINAECYHASLSNK